MNHDPAKLVEAGGKKLRVQLKMQPKDFTCESQNLNSKPKSNRKKFFRKNLRGNI